LVGQARPRLWSQMGRTNREFTGLWCPSLSRSPTPGRLSVKRKGTSFFRRRGNFLKMAKLLATHLPLIDQTDRLQPLIWYTSEPRGIRVFRARGRPRMRSSTLVTSWRSGLMTEMAFHSLLLTQHRRKTLYSMAGNTSTQSLGLVSVLRFWAIGLTSTVWNSPARSKAKS